MPKRDLLRLVKTLRAEVNRVDAAAMKQVTDAYLLMYDNIRGDVGALRLAIEAMENPTVAQIRKMAEYQSGSCRIQSRNLTVSPHGWKHR